MAGEEDVAGFVRALPKAELHLHLEGTLEPGMMLDLAARNGVALPYASVDEARRAYSFGNLQDFLDLYYRGMSALFTEQDFYDLVSAYLTRAKADGIVHVEPFFDPQAHTSRGVAFATVIEGIHRALADGEAKLGITSKLILCFLRHLDESDAERTLDEALPHLKLISGVGLDSSERGHPPAKFQRVFARARGLGLHVVAHAGEEGPAAYVSGALDVLKVERIDHGNHAKDDAALLERLKAEQIGLTMCPLSNLRLGVIKEMREHPLPQMLRQGLLVTVNSDDPAYFGGYLVENYAALAAASDLTREEMRELARNSFLASFLPEAEKKKWIGKI
jgi:adenosine deaminase